MPPQNENIRKGGIMDDRVCAFPVATVNQSLVVRFFYVFNDILSTSLL